MIGWRGNATARKGAAVILEVMAMFEVVGVVAMLLLSAPSAFSQSPSNLTPAELVRKVVDHELQAQDQDQSHWMYLDRDSVKRRTKAVIQTRHGDLSRLLAVDGHPLTPEEQRTEDQHIRNLLADPTAQRKLQQDQRNDGRKTEQLFKMLPEAWTYTIAERNGDEVKLNFKPNPNFHPPSNQARALHEMAGQLRVNAKEMRLAAITGQLMRDVKFGWMGVLGHLAKGGTFDVGQQEVAPGHWQITVLKVHMNGKALFFKTINVRQDELRSHFERVPDSLTLAEAEARLRSSHYQR